MLQFDFYFYQGHRLFVCLSDYLLFFRFEPPSAPNMQIFQLTVMEAFPMAIVGFAVAFSVAKVYAVKHDYLIDGNQVIKQLTWNLHFDHFII